MRRSGLRRTPVRLGVLETLARSDQSLDVPEILSKLPPSTDMVTVYRTLNTFLRKKLVHRVRGEDRSWRYALGEGKRGASHQHPHFACDACGKVECLTATSIPANFVRSLGVGRRYAVAYSEVVLHGTCPKCRPRKESLG